MKVIIANLGLVQVHNACHNALRNSEGIQGRTRMRLDDIIETITPKRESFTRNWKIEIKDRVVHQNGNPMQNEQGYIFKSDEDEQAYEEFIGMRHEFDIDMLLKQELGNIVTESDQFGSADDHYRALKLVTEGFAQQPKTENNNQNDEEE